MKPPDAPARDLSARIAEALCDDILSGRLPRGARLPSEAALGARFSVGRSTVREALQRLTARALIETRRGAQGGAFVRGPDFAETRALQAEGLRFFAAMHAVDLPGLREARFVLERACLPLACEYRARMHLAQMREATRWQSDPALPVQDFHAADAAIHKALAEATCNPLLALQTGSVVETLEGILCATDPGADLRAELAEANAALTDALEARDATGAEACLARVETAMQALAERGAAGRAPQ